MQVLSGSSDGTVKLWSLGQQRCIATYKVHEEGVWALLANDSFTSFYSAGRDRCVWLTDIRQQEPSQLVLEESAPILKVGPLELVFYENVTVALHCQMEYQPDNDSLWVATTNSTINNWVCHPPDSSCVFTDT